MCPLLCWTYPPIVAHPLLAPIPLCQLSKSGLWGQGSLPLILDFELHDTTNFASESLGPESPMQVVLSKCVLTELNATSSLQSHNTAHQR